MFLASPAECSVPDPHPGFDIPGTSSARDQILPNMNMSYFDISYDPSETYEVSLGLLLDNPRTPAPATLSTPTTPIWMDTIDRGGRLHVGEVASLDKYRPARRRPTSDCDSDSTSPHSSADSQYTSPSGMFNSPVTPPKMRYATTPPDTQRTVYHVTRPQQGEDLPWPLYQCIIDGLTPCVDFDPLSFESYSWVTGYQAELMSEEIVRPSFPEWNTPSPASSSVPKKRAAVTKKVKKLTTTVAKTKKCTTIKANGVPRHSA